MKAFFELINTNIKYVYIAIAFVFAILLIWLIKVLIDIYKTLQSKRINIENIQDNLEDTKEKTKYISDVNKKTFVSEALLTAVVVNEVVGDQKESGGKHLVKHTARSLTRKGRIKKYTRIPAKFQKLN